ncbi:MAG: hypothetical protein R3F61_35855 [Myxococcota bacterium]
MTPTLLALLAGCAFAEVPGDAADFDLLRPELLTPARRIDGMTLDELAQVDPRGTFTSIQYVLADIQALSPKDRAGAAASLALLSVTCPYTRASRQLPLALQQVVSTIDPEDLDPLVEQDWKYLQNGLDAHVAVYDALDAQLALPRPGDALHGAPGLLDRAGMKRSTDLVGDTALLVDQIPTLAESLPQATLDHIDQHAQRYEALTGHTAVLKMQMRGWYLALKRILPFVVDPDARMRLQRATYVVESYLGMGC